MPPPKLSLSSSSSKNNNKKIIAGIKSLVRKEFKQLANPENAKIMQNYCKTTMPMWGIKKPDRQVVEKKIYETLQEQSIPMDRTLYRQCVQNLWDMPKREEKYLAIDVALHYKDEIVWENLSLYESLIRDYHDIMWWDFCDGIAINLIGKVALANPTMMEPILRDWINDSEHLWIRRTAILAQLKHKQHTNTELLLEFCRLRMHEKDFFIRKAIGWALREYSKTNPDVVIDFLQTEKPNLSGLSYREGSRILVKKGLM